MPIRKTYLPFIRSYYSPQLKYETEIENYLQQKVFDSASIDLIPLITANALASNTGIITTDFQGKHSCRWIECDSGNISNIFKQGDHYDGLIPIGVSGNGLSYMQTLNDNLPQPTHTKHSPTIPGGIKMVCWNINGLTGRKNWEIYTIWCHGAVFPC